MQREPRLVESVKNEESPISEMSVRRERSETVEPTSKVDSLRREGLASVWGVEPTRGQELGEGVEAVLSWFAGE